jgi:flagellar hook-basal body complex protein FliE
MTAAINAISTAVPEVSTGMAMNVARISSPGAGFASPVATTVASTDGMPFSDLLTDAVGRVGELENRARVTVDGLIAGTGVDVHQAMIAAEKASMAFELALAVRNKAVQAYQSVMSMPF